MIVAFKNNQQNYELLLPILEAITNCVLNKKLCEKFVDLGVLTNIVILLSRWMLFLNVKTLEASL